MQQGTDAHASMHLSDINKYTHDYCLHFLQRKDSVWMKPLIQETKRQHCASARVEITVNADWFVEGEQSAWGVVMYICIIIKLCIVLLSNTAGVVTGYLQDCWPSGPHWIRRPTPWQYQDGFHKWPGAMHSRHPSHGTVCVGGEGEGMYVNTDIHTYYTD